MANYINPDIIGRLAGIGFKANQPVEGTIAGQHRSPLHGLSPEFADYRAYTPGDDLKNLDWKAYGRSDRFYVKRFEEESNLRAFLVVDDSASMNYGEENGTSFTVQRRLPARSRRLHCGSGMRSACRPWGVTSTRNCGRAARHHNWHRSSRRSNEQSV
ncbi:MAG: DUF58 domain-containing protein [Planctomycetaceae bacterium]